MILRTRNDSLKCMKMIATGQSATIVRNPKNEFIHMAPPFIATYRTETTLTHFTSLYIFVNKVAVYTYISWIKVAIGPKHYREDGQDQF